MKKHYRLLLVLVVLSMSTALLGTTTELGACPYCKSKVGEQVNAGIFNDGFWYNAMLALLPLPVLLGIVALIHFGLPLPDGKEGRNNRR